MQQLLILTKQKLFDKIARLKVNIWRVVRVVEGAALEMLCPERDLGFESLTLRQKETTIFVRRLSFFCSIHFSLFVLLYSLFVCYNLSTTCGCPPLFTQERHKLLVNFDIQSKRSDPSFHISNSTFHIICGNLSRRAHIKFVTSYRFFIL
jgi:hypothetical protein